MPDMGGFGRGLLKGALSATEKAAEKVKGAAEAASRKMTDDDAETTQAVTVDSDPDATLVIRNATDPDTTQVVRPQHPNPGRPAPRPETPQGAAFPAPPNTPTGHPGAPPPHHPGAPPPHRPGGTFASRPGDQGSPAGHSGGTFAPRPGDQGSPASRPGGSFAPPLGASAPPSTAQAGHSGAAFAPSAPPAPTPAGPSSGAFASPTGASTSPNGMPASEPSLDDEPEDHADASEVRELVEMFQQLLAKHRPPAGPIPGEWSLGVGDLLGAHPKVPTRIRGLVSKLNRFGGVAYSPQEVAFDGDDVPWEKVTEVRTRHIVDYLVGDAVQQQVENLPMPWFPGRKRLLDALGQALLTVVIATAKNQLDGLEFGMRIPAEIAYKASFGRTKELGAGVVSALVLADPAVNQSLLATARARGVKIVEDEDEMLASADERAEKIREKVAALEAELEKFTKRFGAKR